ncbi:MAG: hypothetical protein FWC91_13330 [Defluviitaleaceae bacterium]|nr:hypothetical protein [Defluviitaleaceae bacterium]
MDGLECSELLLSEVITSSDIFRLDSFFFSKEFLEDKKRLLNLSSFSLNQLGVDIKSFGAYSLNNYVVYQDEGIPFIRCVNIQNGTVDFSDMLYINEEANKLLWKSEIKPNTLLLTMSGTVGGVALATENWTYPANSNQDIAKIKFGNNYNRYVAYVYMLSKYGQNFMRREARGSVQQHVFLSQIEQMRLPMFSNTLECCIEEIIKASHKMQYEANEEYMLAEGLLLNELSMADFTPSQESITIKNFSESFGVTGRIDAEYYQPKYEDIETKINSKYVVKNLCIIHDAILAIDEKKIYKYIELADIGATGNITGCTTAIFTELPTRARRLVKKGQIIVSSIEGSLQSCALVTDEYDGALCSTGFHVLDSASINPETLLLLFKSVPIQQLLKKQCSGTILTAIAKSALEKIPLPLISFDTQHILASNIQTSFGLRHKSEKLLETAKRAVEIAIESGEENAIKWFEEQEA